MSVNVYLNREKLEALPEYRELTDGSTIRGEYIADAKTRPYLMLAIYEEVPEVFLPALEEISVFESYPAYGEREMGVYELKSARAEIDLRDHGNSRRENLVYAVKLTAKTMADARELIHLFRTGQIRPSESYQGGQNDPTRDALEERILELEVELAERNRVLVEVARIEWAIKNSPWPMFRKSAVVQQLQQIRQPSR